MLDDLPGLRDAAEGYRAAATAAGIAWAQHAGTQAAQPPELVYRLCDVDRVPGQLTWFQSQGWELERLLPDGGWVMPWPADIDEALDNLSFALATPFPWRQQLPLFNFEIMLYTFVLADEHQGEIWRYEIRPDTWQSARAATSLGALLTEWRRGIEAGVVFYLDVDQWLHVGDDEHDPFKVLVEQAPGLDPFAFPVPVTDEAALRARQRECVVDLGRIDRPESHRELQSAIAAARASLRT
jgi:hypothetical protein